MVLSVTTVLYVGALSLVNWTKQPANAESVPTYDRSLYVFVFLPGIMMLGILVNFTMGATFSNPLFGDEPFMEWRFGLLGGVTGTLFIGIMLHTVVLGIPYGLFGADPCFGLLDAADLGRKHRRGWI